MRGKEIEAMHQRVIVSLLCLIAAVGYAAQTESKLSETRGTLEKWVETRQLISKTRGDWQADKEMIEQTIALFERELKGVEEQISKVSTNSSQADKERAQTEAAIKAANESLEPSQKFATEFEAQVTKLVPQLPQPLQDILRPLLARLPGDPANTKMKPTERMQVLVGLLNEIDKFNNAVTIFSEKRKNPAGTEVAVETVYVGLGAAYFVNEAGDFAGLGTPGAKGWEWTVKSDIAPSVKEVIRIYRAERTARFVGLPASIK
jgi:hypothetical protein